MPSTLLLSNVPHDCSDDVLKQWVENRGYPVLAVKLIRDNVTGTSPSFAHVRLVNPATADEAERILDGQMLEGRQIQVGRVLRLSGMAARKSA